MSSFSRSPNGELRQHRRAATGKGAEQVGTREVLFLGAAHRFAINSHRLEVDRCFELRLNPGSEGHLERTHLQPGENAVQRADTRCAASEAEDRTAPRLVRSTPLGDRQEASAAAEHAATDKREYSRQGMTSTSGASMIRHGSQSDQERRKHWRAGRHCSSLSQLL